MGSGVLQLLVTDRDTPTNGPPFSFHIVSGNEGRRFQVDQGGLLSLAAPLSAKTATRHQLKIQVREAPPLFTCCHPATHRTVLRPSVMFIYIYIYGIWHFVTQFAVLSVR